jgi:hypothetical protein
MKEQKMTVETTTLSEEIFELLRQRTEPHFLLTGRRGSGHGYEMKLELLQAQKVMEDFPPRLS